MKRWLVSVVYIWTGETLRTFGIESNTEESAQRIAISITIGHFRINPSEVYLTVGEIPKHGKIQT